VLPLLKELRTWFALDSVGSCPPPKEMRERGGGHF